MISLEDYKNLTEYFNVNAVPAELENFVKKINIIYEELLYREEVQAKIKALHEKLDEIDKPKEE